MRITNVKESTNTLFDKASRCEDLEEYKKIFKALESQKLAWAEKIKYILADMNCTAEEFAGKCKVSRVTVQNWKNGSIPKSRDTFIRIGFAANYNLEELNKFLERYGRCQKLYAKNLEDAVYIFVLNSSEIEHTYEKCRKIIDLIKNEIENPFIEECVINDTFELLSCITNLRGVEELAEFIKINAGIFSKQYNKFYSYVEMYININRIGDTSDKNNIAFMMADCAPALRFSVYDIINHKWYPKRDKIISLGIYLNMSTEQINEMLRLTNMEELCAKNPYENAIIFALESAIMENLIHQGTDALRHYVENILVSLGFSDVEILLDEIKHEYEDVF